MTAKLSLAIAKWAHALFPFCDLRTANIILRLNHGKKLRVVRRLFNYKIHLNAYRSAAHVLLYIRGEKFAEDVMFLRPHVKNGMVVFDVGTNIGYLTYFFCSRIGPKGAVFSFEPDPDNWQEVYDNVQANDLSSCRLFQTAVGSIDGTVSFAYGFNGHINADGTQPNCQILTLDSFVKNHSIQQVDLIKVDVEGYELDVLEGMSHMLTAGRKPILYIEVHPLRFCGKGEPAKVCSFLERYYENIRAFRPPVDVRSSLSPWGKFRFQFGSEESVRRKCEVSLKNIKDNQQLRYQLLCLP